MQVTLNNEIIELPIKLKETINENFEKTKKSDYAHYLYGERIGYQKEYECKNLSAGCLLETIDGYYIVGKLDENTSNPTILQVTGGIDKKDIVNEKINTEQTKKLYFLKKDNAVEELKKLNNPRRNYLIPLLQMDSKGVSRENIYLEKESTNL